MHIKVALHGGREPQIASEATTLEGMMSELMRPCEMSWMYDETLQ